MTALARVRALCAAARRLKDPGDPLGREARARLPESTGLSAQNVELALSEILETAPSEAELHALCSAVEPAPRVHVSLAANVFTAPLRAIALGLAQTTDVFVRPSRREPVFSELLRRASPTFTLVDALAPEPGDHLWAYGSDATLDELRRALGSGVVLHAHGSGYGLALVAPGDRGAASALCQDIVPFDQRGCLSPRAAVVVGTAEEARTFARALAAELERSAEQLPLGALDAEEQAESTRLRETLRYAGQVFPAGPGWVALDATDARLVESPVGRRLVVTRSEAALDWLAASSSRIVTVGASAALVGVAKQLFPDARVTSLGAMQRPVFDGPVDTRPCARAHLV